MSGCGPLYSGQCNGQQQFKPAEQQSSRAVQWPVQHLDFSSTTLDTLPLFHRSLNTEQALSCDEMSLSCQLPRLSKYDADLTVFFTAGFIILVHPVAQEPAFMTGGER